MVYIIFGKNLWITRELRSSETSKFSYIGFKMVIRTGNSGGGSSLWGESYDLCEIKKNQFLLMFLRRKLKKYSKINLLTHVIYMLILKLIPVNTLAISATDR